MYRYANINLILSGEVSMIQSAYQELGQIVQQANKDYERIYFLFKMFDELSDKELMAHFLVDSNSSHEDYREEWAVKCSQLYMGNKLHLSLEGDDEGLSIELFDEFHEFYGFSVFIKEFANEIVTLFSQLTVVLEYSEFLTGCDEEINHYRVRSESGSVKCECECLDEDEFL